MDWVGEVEGWIEFVGGMGERLASIVSSSSSGTSPERRKNKFFYENKFKEYKAK